MSDGDHHCRAALAGCSPHMMNTCNKIHGSRGISLGKFNVFTVRGGGGYFRVTQVRRMCHRPGIIILRPQTPRPARKKSHRLLANGGHSTITLYHEDSTAAVDEQSMAPIRLADSFPTRTMGALQESIPSGNPGTQAPSHRNMSPAHSPGP